MLALLLRGILGITCSLVRLLIIGANKPTRTKYDEQRKERHL